MAEPASAVGGATKSAGKALGRVPKWAWVASAGVAVGIIYTRRTRKGDTADNTPANDVTPIADAGISGQSIGSGYVDVPASGGGAAPVDPGPGIDIPSLIGALKPDPGPTLPDIISALGPLIPASPPPSSSATQTAPAPSTPTPSAPQAAAKTTGTTKPCPTKYPLRSSRGCYQVVCADGKGSRRKGRWHVYDPASGVPDQFVSPNC